MTHSAAHLRAYHRRHAELREALLGHDTAQAREFQALREEATVLNAAGLIVDSGPLAPSTIAKLQRYGESSQGAGRIVRQAIAKAERWQRIPEIGRRNARPIAPAGTPHLAVPPCEEPAGASLHDRSAA